MLLTRHFNGENFPIAYVSKKLLPREKHYAAFEKECLSIVWAVKKFEYYLAGRMFEIHIDYKPLLYIDAKKFLKKRIMRWSLVLKKFRCSKRPRQCGCRLLKPGEPVNNIVCIFSFCIFEWLYQLVFCCLKNS